MFWVLTDDIDPTATTNNFTLRTHRFDACSNFHRVNPSFHPIRYSSLGWIVWRHFKPYPISGHNAYIIQTHLARQVTKYDPIVGQLHPKQGIGQAFNYFTFHLNIALVCHNNKNHPITPMGFCDLLFYPIVCLWSIYGALSQLQQWYAQKPPKVIHRQ